ncbi:MAG TPA: DUF222 domain-containing protein [Streptosporangiaceae bacterium]
MSERVDGPPWLDDGEPPWLNEEMPPDPEGDGREWPGDLAEVMAQAEADEAEQAMIRERLLANDVETGFAHTPGAPVIPGIQAGPAGGFGQGQPWDIAAPDPVLDVRADHASGVTRDFVGVSDDELFGLLGARRRLEARQAWERLAAISEIIRRRPAPGCKLRGPAAMPRVWAEGTAGELTIQLAVTRRAADHLLSVAWDLAAKLPLTSAKLRDGVVDENKAATICSYCANLTPEEARRAEQILFGHPDVETMTWNMIRDRIARAVIEVNPDAARRRREDAAQECRIEVRAEESGNAMIAGRELPPVAVLRMDQLINARAKAFKRAGVDGDMDTLRVLAFMERFGEADPLGDLAKTATPPPAGGRGGASGGDETSGEDRGAGERAARRDDPGPGDPGPGDPGPGDSGPGDSGSGGPGPGDSGSGGPGRGGPGGGTCSCGGNGPGRGIAAQIHLTAPVATLTELAERPGVLRGTGPVDPALARELADAAARHSRTRYDFTLTDANGHPVAHACGSVKHQTRHNGQGAPIHGPPRLTLVDRGPPGTYGTWLYRHGEREIIFEFEDLTGPCDHRHQAKGHDPGKHLRHLTGVLNQTCTHPACRRPHFQCDYEHSWPYDLGGITCLCACGPVCRRDHLDKQSPGWTLEGTGDPGYFRWKTPSGRSYLTGPTTYPT